jgi:hypothetical protein
MTPAIDRSSASCASPPIIGSSGFSRSAPPLWNRIGSTPHMAASCSYSPLGSITQAVRPNSNCLQRNVLTRELFA